MKICKKCGASDWRSSGDCRPCAKIRDKKYRLLNKDKIKSYDKKYSFLNKEKIKLKKLISRKEHYLKNKEYVNIVNEAWRKNNIERVRSFKRINEQNRRARKRENGGVLSKGLTERLFKLQRGKCACCKQPLGDDYHLDHIMPIALGGVNEDWNMQLLASFCNIQKHAKHPIEFMQSKGFLL